VGSTEIAAQLDPEEWREAVASYHHAATQAITRFGGYVAQYLGDGVIAYFGWPEAHDNNAERAARAGLATIEAISKPNLQPTHPRLSARVGIHSGTVVVGTGAGGDAEVFGETPNIAARVQAAALPDSVLITAATHRLVSGLFVVESPEPQTLRGIQVPITLFRVIRPTGVRGRLGAARGLTPFVGREQELRLLLSRWQHTRQGDGQLVLVVGEAGIGKSRLVAEFHDRIRETPHIWMETAGEQLFENSPLRAITGMLSQWLELQAGVNGGERISHLERALMSAGLKLDETVPLIGELLQLPVGERYPALPLTSEQKRQRLLAALAGWLFGAARLQPLVMVVEDLHWLDPSTLDLQELMAEQGKSAPLMLLYTARPEFRAQWQMRAHHTQIKLDRLSDLDVREMIGLVAARSALARESVDALIERTSGVPLFVEELTRAVLESGGVEHAGGSIPATLHDSLMARLDRLGAARDTLQLGAVLGTEFAYDLLLAVNPLSENVLQRHLLSLTEAELLYGRGQPPDGSYQFKHALIRDAAYGALLKSKRREVHARIARTMEERFPERAASQPEILAYHYTEAGLIAEAVDNWGKAGKAAIVRSAHAEAIAHLRTALELLPKLPISQERDRTELSLLNDYGVALIVLKGWSVAEVGEVYRRARELCKQLGETARLIRVLFGLSSFHLVRAELQVSHSYAEEMHSLPFDSLDEKMVVIGWSVGAPKFFIGEFATAHENFENAISHYDRRRHRSIAFSVGQDLCATSLAYDAMALLIMGSLARAEERQREAVALARELGYPFTLTHCLTMAAKYCCIRREFDRLPEIVKEAKPLAKEHGFSFYEETIIAYEIMYLAAKGKTEELKTAMRRATRFSELGFGLALTWGLSSMAEGLANLGRLNIALLLVNQAFEMMARTGERYAEAELHRIRAVLALKQADGRECGPAELAFAYADAESSFRNAQEIARRQGAKLFELRAATSLSRLLIETSRKDQARGILAAVYNSFTEGFDAPDLRIAHEVLRELGITKIPRPPATEVRADGD
jgi:class 3 adenylate cyclase